MAFLSLWFLSATACLTVTASQPAVLENDRPQTIALLEAQLAEALGRGTVRLGAGDFTKTSAVPVLPPAPGLYETRSPAVTVIFDLVIEQEGCIAVNRVTGDRIVLQNIKCLSRV